jgi:hypothetical protein
MFLASRKEIRGEPQKSLSSVATLNEPFGRGSNGIETEAMKDETNAKPDRLIVVPRKAKTLRPA